MSLIAITSSNPFTISSRKIGAMTDNGMVRPCSSPASKRGWPGLYPGLGSPSFLSLWTDFLIQGARELIGPERIMALIYWRPSWRRPSTDGGYQQRIGTSGQDLESKCGVETSLRGLGRTLI